MSGNDPRVPLTVLYTVSGDYALARKYGEEMLAFHRARGDGVKAILAYYALSSLELAEGNYERIRAYGLAARQDFKATGHRYLWSYFLNNWGKAERMLGNLDEAKRLCRESYGHMRDLGSTEGMTTALHNIATIAIHQGDYAEAQAILARNLATYRDLGDVGNAAATLERLGDIALRQKDIAEAARLFGEALQTGVSLASITLSILSRVSGLLLEAALPQQAIPILALVMQHPASEQRAKARVQQQIEHYQLDLGRDDRNGRSGADRWRSAALAGYAGTLR